MGLTMAAAEKVERPEDGCMRASNPYEVKYIPTKAVILLLRNFPNVTGYRWYLIILYIATQAPT